ncbi:MAG TPA: thioredoxin family protein [Candidatus Binatia bacterium]
MLSDQETIRPGQPFTVGIALRPAAGWHTYWQNPGDSGLPTRVEWKLPDGFRAGELQWPHPVRLGNPPFVTFGYEGDSLLLTDIQTPDSAKVGEDIQIVATAKWLACREDACVPGKADLPLKIRVEDAPAVRDSRVCDLFDAARQGVPRSLDGWSAKFSGNADTMRFEISGPKDSRPSTNRLDLFPLEGRIVDASAQARTTTTDDGFVVEVARDKHATGLPDHLGLVVVADGGWDFGGNVHALRVDARNVAAAAPGSAAAAAPAAAPVPAAVPAPGAAPAPTPATEARGGEAASPAPARVAQTGVGDITLWAAISLAFLGGLVLNLMPCVFPVLSLKILGFVHVAHSEPAAVRRHGYAFCAGVVVSFWVLAALLLSLRAAGDALGWGFQLQEPRFVALMIALLFMLALNLLGVFEFGGSLSAVAGRMDSGSGYVGAFASGALATVLATPCTAPFMGSALGYALVQPAPAAVAVFTSLGVGMASPYLLLSCVPRLLARLPRPGPWMERLRQAMAFPLLATVAWLIWVFGRETGNDGVLLLLLSLLLLAMAAWMIGGEADGPHPVARFCAGLSVAGSVVLTLAAASAPTPATGSTAVSEGAVVWQPWDPGGIARHRSEGRAVFVDFTADWCLSCKVNERVALTGDDFAGQLRAAGAVAMKADWTRSDPRITEALASFGRSGVPLYVVYPRDPARDPIVLPQVLTPSVVHDALAKALS